MHVLNPGETGGGYGISIDDSTGTMQNVLIVDDKTTPTLRRGVNVTSASADVEIQSLVVVNSIEAAFYSNFASADVVVHPTLPLVVSSTANPTSGEAPLTTNFTSNPSGGSGFYTYSWDFGDGNTSTAQNPSHTYSNTGSYTATVTVSDSVTTSQSSTLISLKPRSLV